MSNGNDIKFDLKIAKTKHFDEIKIHRFMHIEKVKNIQFQGKFKVEGPKLNLR